MPLSPLQVVQAQLDAFNAKDLDALMRAYAPDAEQFTLHGERLAQGHEQMRARYAIRFTEPDMDIVPCFAPENQDCPLRRACRLKGALERARLAFLHVLDEYTLADLTWNQQALQSSLGLAAPVG